MNKSQKGNYYKLKTKKWYEKQDYAVESIEKSYRIYDRDNDKIIFVKKDLWGGDLVACKKVKGSQTIVCRDFMKELEDKKYSFEFRKGARTMFSCLLKYIDGYLDEMLWIQVKSNPSHINAGLKELAKSPLPSFVRKIVMCWPSREREPEVYECEV